MVKKTLCTILCLLTVAAMTTGCMIRQPRTFKETAEAGRAFMEKDGPKSLKITKETGENKTVLDGIYDKETGLAVFSYSVETTDTVKTYKDMIKIKGDTLYVKVPDLSGLDGLSSLLKITDAVQLPGYGQEDGDENGSGLPGFDPEEYFSGLLEKYGGSDEMTKRKTIGELFGDMFRKDREEDGDKPNEEFDPLDLFGGLIGAFGGSGEDDRYTGDGETDIYGFFGDLFGKYATDDPDGDISTYFDGDLEGLLGGLLDMFGNDGEEEPDDGFMKEFDFSSGLDGLITDPLTGALDGISGKYVSVKIPGDVTEKLRAIFDSAEQSSYEKTEESENKEDRSFTASFTQDDAKEMLVSLLDSINAKKDEIVSALAASVRERLGQKTCENIEKITGAKIEETLSGLIDDFFENVRPGDIFAEGDGFSLTRTVKYELNKKFESETVFTYGSGEETVSTKITVTAEQIDGDPGLETRCAIAEDEIFDAGAYLKDITEKLGGTVTVR